jgi:hypothetical protein
LNPQWHGFGRALIFFGAGFVRLSADSSTSMPAALRMPFQTVFDRVIVASTTRSYSPQGRPIPRIASVCRTPEMVKKTTFRTIADFCISAGPASGDIPDPPDCDGPDCTSKHEE